MIISNDIETALYFRLTADGYSASSHVIPAAVETMLPHIHVMGISGYTSDRVLEVHNVAFDVYAETQADAKEEASHLCGWVRALEGTTVGTPCYASEVIGTPYHNPDPRHPNIGRATFKAQITVRVKEV